VLDLTDRVEYVGKLFSRLEAANAREVGFAAQRVVDGRTLSLHEVELHAHRFERQQEIGEENRGVDVDAADRLKCDFRR
jgi:hypothetical protein